MLLSLPVVEGNSLAITLFWKLEGDALIFNMVYGNGHPLTIGIVVSAYSKKSVEVMLRLD